MVTNFRIDAQGERDVRRIGRIKRKPDRIFIPRPQVRLGQGLVNDFFGVGKLPLQPGESAQIQPSKSLKTLHRSRPRQNEEISASARVFPGGFSLRNDKRPLKIAIELPWDSKSKTV